MIRRTPDEMRTAAGFLSRGGAAAEWLLGEADSPCPSSVAHHLTTSILASHAPKLPLWRRILRKVRGR